MIALWWYALLVAHFKFIMTTKNRFPGNELYFTKVTTAGCHTTVAPRLAVSLVRAEPPTHASWGPGGPGFSTWWGLRCVTWHRPGRAPSPCIAPGPHSLRNNSTSSSSVASSLNPRLALPGTTSASVTEPGNLLGDIKHHWGLVFKPKLGLTILFSKQIV